MAKGQGFEKIKMFHAKRQEWRRVRERRKVREDFEINGGKKT